MKFSWISDDDAKMNWLSRAHGLTARQLSLCCGGAKGSVARRLGQYRTHGLVSATPMIEGAGGAWEKEYYLTSANVRKIRKYRNLELKPLRERRSGSIAHKRMVNDIWVGIYAALAEQDVYTSHFLPYYHYDTADAGSPVYLAAPDERRSTPVERTGIADAVIVFSCARGKTLLFLEADMGTESIASGLDCRATLTTKLEMYARFHDANGFRRYGEMFGFDFTGFRVLVVTTSRKHGENIRARCKLSSPEFIWFADFSEIIAKGMFGPIWITGEGKQGQPLLLQYQAGPIS